MVNLKHGQGAGLGLSTSTIATTTDLIREPEPAAVNPYAEIKAKLESILDTMNSNATPSTPEDLGDVKSFLASKDQWIIWAVLLFVLGMLAGKLQVFTGPIQLDRIMPGLTDPVRIFKFRITDFPPGKFFTRKAPDDQRMLISFHSALSSHFRNQSTGSRKIGHPSFVVRTESELTIRPLSSLQTHAQCYFCNQINVVIFISAALMFTGLILAKRSRDCMLSSNSSMGNNTNDDNNPILRDIGMGDIQPNDNAVVQACSFNYFQKYHLH